MKHANVTVVMPIAPRAQWLDACLKSLLVQTFRDWDLVAVLDGECAQNQEVLAASGLGSRLRTVQLPGGSGVAHALNTGMRHTTAPYVARMDADDICKPERLSAQVDAMDRRPAVWAMGSSAIIVNSLGQAVGFRHVPETPRKVRSTLMWRNALIHPSVIMRRERVLDIGGYNTSSERMEDYELWLRIAAVAELDNLPQALIEYRIHETQHSRGRRLGQTGEIRRARRAAANGPIGRARAEVRHSVWLGAQVLREGK